MLYNALVSNLRAILQIMKDSDLSLNLFITFEHYTCVSRLLAILRCTIN